MLNIPRDSDIDVAELLVCADFLKPVQLDRAYAASRDSFQTLGEILLDERLVEPRVFSAAKQIAIEIRSGRIRKQDARNALYLMGNLGLSLQDVLAKLGIESPKSPWTSHLGALATSGKYGAVS